jgi:hypothetical protein
MKSQWAFQIMTLLYVHLLGEMLLYVKHAARFEIFSGLYQLQSLSISAIHQFSSPHFARQKHNFVSFVFTLPSDSHPTPTSCCGLTERREFGDWCLAITWLRALLSLVRLSRPQLVAYSFSCRRSLMDILHWREKNYSRMYFASLFTERMQILKLVLTKT